MPFYIYACEKHEWEVAKSISAIDDPEDCPKCGARGDRQVTLPAGTVGASDWNAQTFNNGLGCYTRSNKHAEQIAKSRGLEPVGTEPVESIHKAMERTQQETRQGRWANADREMLYD